jgi:transposase
MSDYSEVVRDENKRKGLSRRTLPRFDDKIPAWTSHNRRLARDFERYARSVAAFIRLAMIRIMLRRLTNPTLCS